MTVYAPQLQPSGGLGDLMPTFDAALIDELLGEMRSLNARAYAEIGVPMFMVGEDLTPTASPQPRRGGRDTDLATVFARLAQALAEHRGELDACDIGQLLELLADRHLLHTARVSFSRTPALHPGPA